MVATAALGLWAVGGRLLAPDTDSPDSRADSSAGGMEELHVRATDGAAPRGWRMAGEGPARAIILLHGFDADRRTMLARAKWIREVGYSVFLLTCGAVEKAEEGSPPTNMPSSWTWKGLSDT